MHAPTPDQPRTPRLSRAFMIPMLVLSGLYVWLVGNLPYVALGFATYDDQLFVKLAAYILNGQWLGPYDDTTLAKGPFLSLWIAASWLLHLPLLMSEALLYAAACVLLLAAVRPHFRWSWPVLPILMLLLLNPTAWDALLLRIVREGLYAPLTLLVLALAAWAFGRPRRGFGVGWGLALGLAFGCFWITREEGIWLLPTLGVLWLGLWLGVPVGPGATPAPTAWRPRLARLGLVSVAALAGWAVIFGGLLAINKHVYGVANTVEFKQQEFLSAYGALARVSPERRRRYVPLPVATLPEIAAASPSVAELVPALQARREAWAAPGCATQGVMPCDGEWRGGWFMWALRDAVRAAGHAATAGASRDFYRRLAEEVNLACSEGRLTCAAFRATITPAFQRDDLRPTLDAFVRGVERLARFTASGPVALSDGVPYYTRIFFDLVEGPHMPLGSVLILRLVTKTPGAVESVGISDGGNTGLIESQIRPLPDAAPDGAGNHTTRLDVQTDCRQPGCRLFLAWAGGKASLPLADILTVGIREQDGLRIETELVRDTAVRPVLPSLERGQRVMRALQSVQRAYGAVMPALSLLALLLLVGQIVAAIRRRRIDFILLLQLGLWVGIGGRLVLLSVLDATMFPGINTLYLAPLYPMLLAAVALSLWRGAEGIAGWVRRLLDEGWTGFRPASD